MHDGALQLPDFFCQDIHFYPIQKILIHLILLHAIRHLSVKRLDLFQSAHPQLDLIQRMLQILVSPHILPQDIYIDFLLV